MLNPKIGVVFSPQILPFGGFSPLFLVQHPFVSCIFFWTSTFGEDYRTMSSFEQRDDIYFSGCDFSGCGGCFKNWIFLLFKLSAGALKRKDHRIHRSLFLIGPCQRIFINNLHEKDINKLNDLPKSISHFFWVNNLTFKHV